MRSPVSVLVGSSLAALCFCGPAMAAEDVVLSNLGTWNGSPVDQAVTMDAYELVVNQLKKNPKATFAQTSGDALSVASSNTFQPFPF